MERLRIIKEKKIILWFILFFPVAIYRSIKYRALPKWANAIIIVFILLICIVVADAVINPDRVTDRLVESAIEDYIEDNYGKITNFEYTFDERMGTVNVIINTQRKRLNLEGKFTEDNKFQIQKERSN